MAASWFLLSMPSMRIHSCKYFLAGVSEKANVYNPSPEGCRRGLTALIRNQMGAIRPTWVRIPLPPPPLHRGSIPRRRCARGTTASILQGHRSRQSRSRLPQDPLAQGSRGCLHRSESRRSRHTPSARSEGGRGKPLPPARYARLASRTRPGSRVHKKGLGA